MTWFKVDDKFWSSPERLGTSNAAIGAWVTAGSYCADQLTDGVVSKNARKMLGIRPGLASELVERGLWIAHENGDVSFKNWSKFNPSKADVEARRNRLREAGRAGGKRSGESRRGEKSDPEPEADAKHDASQSLSMMPRKNEASPVELPTRPVPTTSNEVVQKTSSTAARSTASDPAGFDEFWAAYPRRVGKGQARTAYAKAIAKAGQQAVLDGALRFATDPNLPEGQYVPHPATWLNGERWTDDPLPAKGRQAGPAPLPQLTPNERKHAAAELLKSNPNPAVLQAAGFDWGPPQTALPVASVRVIEA
ncbi:hypothetical protein [Nocardia niigatensis]